MQVVAVEEHRDDTLCVFCVCDFGDAKGGVGWEKGLGGKRCCVQVGGYICTMYTSCPIYRAHGCM